MQRSSGTAPRDVTAGNAEAARPASRGHLSNWRDGFRRRLLPATPPPSAMYRPVVRPPTRELIHVYPTEDPVNWIHRDGFRRRLLPATPPPSAMYRPVVRPPTRELIHVYPTEDPVNWIYRDGFRRRLLPATPPPSAMYRPVVRPPTRELIHVYPTEDPVNWIHRGDRRSDIVSESLSSRTSFGSLSSLPSEDYCEDTTENLSSPDNEGEGRDQCMVSVDRADERPASPQDNSGDDVPIYYSE